MLSWQARTSRAWLGTEVPPLSLSRFLRPNLRCHLSKIVTFRYLSIIVSPGVQFDGVCSVSFLQRAIVQGQPRKST